MLLDLKTDGVMLSGFLADSILSFSPYFLGFFKKNEVAFTLLGDLGLSFSLFSFQT